MSIAAVIASGVIVITCAGERASSIPVASIPADPTPTPVPTPNPEPTPTLDPTPAPPVALPEGALPLPKLYAAMRDLRDGKRATHVRILWLGDSHTAADLWTGTVRRSLQAKLGDGGIGFIHVGWAPPKYRHEGVKIDVAQAWNIAPATYAKTTREDDGIFGLGGVRLSPAEGDARVTIEPTDEGLGGEMSWDLAYREQDGAMHVTVGELAADLPLETDDRAPSGIRHHTFRAAAGTKMEIAVTRGRPQLFGVTIEGKKPGIVLDTVGLNGARMATFLAWDDAAWSAEVARRKPDLVVFAFGTNESSDEAPKEEPYRKQLLALLGRVRAGAPETECLVVLPMDRSGTDHEKRLATISRGMEAAAKEAGCATWSAFTAMGGAGSIEAWAHESPPRAGQDGVHLTTKGYRYLGERLATALLRGL